MPVIFPEIWSAGYVIPLHKKGNRNNPNNYRGIALLSNLGKNFTSVLTARADKWIEDIIVYPTHSLGSVVKNFT